jgi:D-alanyl-D-alanine-carboxypeptidase/D-alanyl-D-alanine-endopeptidase
MAQLTRIVHERVDSKRSTGIAAGLVFADGTTRFVAYGDAGHGKRLVAGSVFEIGSISKTFTATLLADMVRRGEVHLSDHVASLLPKRVSVPSHRGRQITLEDLATQTSGLPPQPTNQHPEDPANPYADYTVAQLYEFLDHHKLTRAPGARFEYSNVGVGLLGHALALRAGKPYEDLVRERILLPLGMTGTVVRITADIAPRFAAGHDASGSVVEHWDLPTLAGAGGLRSSITDMLRYASANLGGAGPLRRAMAFARVPRRVLGPGRRIGLNWFIDRNGRRVIVNHNGVTAGFRSFIGLDEAHHTAVVLLSNEGREDVDDIGFHMLDATVPLAQAPTPHKAITLTTHVIDGYVGVYDLPGYRLTVTRSTSGLLAHISDEPTYPLSAESKTSFFATNIERQVTFQVDLHGKATGVVVTDQDGQTLTGGKIS